MDQEDSVADPRSTVLVAIPCLNEEAVVGDVIRSIPRSLPGLGGVVVLLVDDGSTDRSASVARDAGAVVLSHGRRRGVGAAFQTAITYALQKGFGYFVQIDADGQFDAGEIQSLLAPILSGRCDFVTGSRFLPGSTRIEHQSAAKRLGNFGIAWWVSRLTGRRFYDVSCGFRAYSREAMLRVNPQALFTYTQETILDLAFQGVRMEEVAVHVRYFPGRRSRVADSLWRYAWRTSKIILRAYRDYRPLRSFGWIAAVFFVPGISLFAFFLWWRWESGNFSPHLWAGFSGAGLCLLALAFLGLGIVADMFTRVRINQQAILYYLRDRSS